MTEPSHGEGHAPAAEVAQSPPGTETTSETPPPVRATRAGRAWVAIVLGIALVALLLVFIFQNLHTTRLHFFTAVGSVSVALALVIAAIGGAVVVVLVGSVRILQLRRGVRASYREGARRQRRSGGA